MADHVKRVKQVFFLQCNEVMPLVCDLDVLWTIPKGTGSVRLENQ